MVIIMVQPDELMGNAVKYLRRPPTALAECVARHLVGYYEVEAKAFQELSTVITEWHR